MRRYFDDSGTQTSLRALLEQAEADGAQGALILAREANEFSQEQLDPLLRESSIPLFGGIFPRIIYGAQRVERGTIVLSFIEHRPAVSVIDAISDADTDIAELLSKVDAGGFRSMFVFVDAFATRIDTLINELYFEFGLENHFLGGGAGSLSFEQKPTVITPAGLKQDAAVLASVADDCHVGVQHGWQRIAGPYQVTLAEGNIIQELDFKPAFDVYRSVVEAASSQVFADDNFFEIAKGYPFGISKLDAERVVRDPVSVAKSAGLVCVGNVNTGEFVDILCGEAKHLLDATSRAVELSVPGPAGKGTIFIDCISRVLFLQDEFQKEVDIVAAGDPSVIGALTLGEIANTGKDYLEFYNKTAVVAAF